MRTRGRPTTPRAAADRLLGVLHAAIEDKKAAYRAWRHSSDFLTFIGELIITMSLLLSILVFPK